MQIYMEERGHLNYAIKLYPHILIYNTNTVLTFGICQALP